MGLLSPSYEGKDQRYFSGVRKDLIDRLGSTPTAQSWKSDAAMGRPEPMQNSRASAAFMSGWSFFRTQQTWRRL